MYITRDARRFGPKAEDHPSVGERCGWCDVPFEAGDYTTLAVVGPADKENQVKMEAGRPYTAEAHEVHWT